MSYLKFKKGFKYALEGILYCIINERNFRFEIAMAIFTLIIKRYYIFDSTKNILLFITIAIVLSTEAINTAIEAVVDLYSTKYHKLAKAAKDAGAGAVLINSLISVIIGVYLFGDINGLKNLFHAIKTNVWFDIFIIFYIILSYIFTFKIFKKIRK